MKPSPNIVEVVQELRDIVAFNRTKQPVGTVPMFIPMELADRAAKTILIAVNAMERARQEMEFGPKEQGVTKAYRLIKKALQKIYSIKA